MRLYDWDGKALKEKAVLEGSKGVVSALSFSPDGTYLAAGDVSFAVALNSTLLCLALISALVKSSGRISLFDTKENKVHTGTLKSYTSAQEHKYSVL